MQRDFNLELTWSRSDWKKAINIVRRTHAGMENEREAENDDDDRWWWEWGW